jgi:hypothetical protein
MNIDRRPHIADRQTELGLIFPPHVVVAKIFSHSFRVGKLKRVQLWADSQRIGFVFPFGSVCTFLATIEIAIAQHKLSASCAEFTNLD